MSKPGLMQIVAEALAAGEMPGSCTGIVVGVSGGPDSMALLDVLEQLNRRHEYGWRPAVAHINHGLRGAESDADEAFVRAEAARRGLPIFVRTMPADGRDTAIEERARRARYAFFEEVCGATGSRFVALGHHADDQAETILFRLLRGTGMRGAGGMRAVRALRPGSDLRVIRPLLSARREQILEYLQARGLAYRVDASNESDVFARNRIRRHVLPLLCETVHPRVTEALVRLGEEARGIDAVLGAVAESLLANALRGADEDRLRLDPAGLAMQEAIVRAEVVRRAAARLGLREGRLSAARLRAAAEVLGERRTARGVELPGGVRVRRCGREVVIERGRAVRPMPLGETAIIVPGVTELREAGLRLRAEVMDAAGAMRMPGAAKSALVETLDFERIVPPLCVRARRAGERFTPLGASGSRKLSDFMIDRKIERRGRARTPLLCDAQGVVWVIAHRIDERVRLTAGSRRVLRVQVEPLGAAAAPAPPA